MRTQCPLPFFSASFCLYCKTLLKVRRTISRLKAVFYRSQAFLFIPLFFEGLRFAQLPIRKSEHKSQLANASKLLTSQNTEELPPKVFFKKNLVVLLFINSFVIILYRLYIYNFRFTEYDFFKITSIIFNC